MMSNSCVNEEEPPDDPATHPFLQPVVEEKVSNDVCISMENLGPDNNTEVPAQNVDSQSGASDVQGAFTPENNEDTDQPIDNDFISEDRVTIRLNTQLLNAIENQNNEEVKRLLQDGANVNATRSINFMSACHVAAKYNNAVALSLLLKLKADKNSKDYYGRTPLHHAAMAGSNSAIAVLLEFPKDLQQNIGLGMTPEIEEKVIKLASERIFESIDIPVEDTRSFFDIVPTALRTFDEGHQFEPSPSDESDWTPLHFASFRSHHTTTRLLLVAGANPNVRNAHGRTCLDVAGSAVLFDGRQILETDKTNYEKTIEALIKYGGKINKPYRGNVFQTAVEMGSVKAIHVLLAMGASIDLGHFDTSPLHVCVKKRNKELLQILAMQNQGSSSAKPVNMTDRFGHTPLHAAILDSWLPGVCIALEAGADVTLQDKYGCTAIHLAAVKGNVDILKKVLDVAEIVMGTLKNAVNIENGCVESPLLCAIRSGNLDCVKTILEAGGSLQITFYVEPGNKLNPKVSLPYKNSDFLSNTLKPKFNIMLHVLAEIGDVTILKYLFKNHLEEFQPLLFDKCPSLMNMIPLEYAAYNKRFENFKFLLEEAMGHPVLERIFNPSSLLDIISQRNDEDIYLELMSKVPDAVRIATRQGHTPLHNAIKYCNRNVVLHMIDNGADLSQSDDSGDTAICLIMEHISKPTEFIEGMFDCYIKTNDIPIQNRDCVVTVDYRVLIPPESQMSNKGDLRVVKALLEHDSNTQRKLLAHPLVESFLYLKWKTFSTYFYLMAFFQLVFVVLLTVYIVSVFYYKDDKKRLPVLAFFNPPGWRIATYVFLAFIVLPEFVSFNIELKDWTLINIVEFVAKFCTYILAIATPVVVTLESEDTEWWRHLATVTLMLAWSTIMILLSKAPKPGYYIHMFLKVSEKILKILATFLFLLFMFSFCFMVQFHSKAPFDGPLTAIVKTYVMMSSEFEYDSNFNEKNAKDIGASAAMLRILFVVFMFLAAIVLMNLMIGVAVNDVQYLIQDGNLRRIERQLEFLNIFDTSRRKKSLYHKFRLYRWFNWKKVPQNVEIKPVNDGKCCFKGHIKEMILNKVQEQVNKTEKEAESMKNESKLDEIFQAITVKEQNIMKVETKLDEILQAIVVKEENIMKIERNLDKVLNAVSINKGNTVRTQNWTRSFKHLRQRSKK